MKVISKKRIINVLALTLLGSQVITLLPMDLEDLDEHRDNNTVYFHLPKPEDIQLDTIAWGTAFENGAQSDTEYELTEEEEKIVASENISPAEQSKMKKVIVHLKKAGLWTKNLIKNNIFNILGVENTLVALLVMYDFIHSKADSTAELITPQWALATNTAVSISALAATSYAQYCKNKIEKIKNAVTSTTYSAWHCLKKNAGYIYAGANGAFYIATLIDTFDKDFEIPRTAYFIAQVQGLLGSMGLFAAQYYQKKLELLEQEQSLNNSKAKAPTWTPGKDYHFPDGPLVEEEEYAEMPVSDL